MEKTEMIYYVSFYHRGTQSIISFHKKRETTQKRAAEIAKIYGCTASYGTGDYFFNPDHSANVTVKFDPIME
jgi:hypothetical protein